ncbi:nuclear pore complex protein Nup98-Nup96-like [Toxorhynchites rutilus septentrionalis]|uniref:nuclear pore complex protein Nup98-Nup96-like n=1 Tax=Toxorhynchites rutilus septentrionalis TaxID=329112 RepID=UPI00247A687C|nr:nuclear pore complex protein Nup98-Nup96-like [Toxorhynchites rutilus septentrionalis]
MDAEILLLYFAAVEQIQGCKFLLKVKQWSQAYEIIMEHIATDCVINVNFPYLESLLNEFKDVKHISKKFIKGQILSDFIELNVKFDLLGMLSTTRWPRLCSKNSSPNYPICAP